MALRSGEGGGLISLALLLIIGAIYLDPVWGFKTDKYKGFKVLRFHPATEEETDRLLKLLPSGENSHVYPVRRRRSTSVDVTLSPTDLADLLELIELLQIPHETLVDDLRIALDDHIKEVGGSKPEREPFGLDRFNTFDEIRNWLYDQANIHREMMEITEIGKSWEKRPLLVVRLHSPTSGRRSKDKPALWMDAGIHANEWVGPATLVFYIHELLAKYSHDATISSLLEIFDVFIMPIFNPDGYAYSWLEDRLWRKSRSLRNTSECAGVDMNRNWPYKWGIEPGVSKDPCSVIYGGPTARSEPEVQAVTQFLDDHSDVIKAYIAFHSYSQLWMMPFSYSNDKPKDYAELVNISQLVVEAIEQTNGKEYHYGTVKELLGEASGSSVDYTYGELNIKYSFGVELRDDGLFGSLLPPSQIVPTALESLEGIKTLANIINDKITI